MNFSSAIHSLYKVEFECLFVIDLKALYAAIYPFSSNGESERWILKCI